MGVKEELPSPTARSPRRAGFARVFAAITETARKFPRAADGANAEHCVERAASNMKCSMTELPPCMGTGEAASLYGEKLTQKAPKPETLKGLSPGHLSTVGRRALWGSYDF